MAVAQFDIESKTAYGGRARERWACGVLFTVLAAYTLCVLDGGEIAPRLISTAFLTLAAAYFSVPFAQRLRLSIPALCLLSMVLWGVGQILWSPQKIVYNGWMGVLFWFTAVMICLAAGQIFQSSRLAFFFRLSLVLFGGAISLLDLLEQASHATAYYWLIPSKFHAVFGPFAYWNNFAQFIELSLPITLWLGLTQRSSSAPYLVLSALQIGAVVASGSRAGTALVFLEVFAVIGLVYSRRRDRKLVFGTAFAVVLAAVLTYAAGYDTVIHKLQQQDQLTVRRSINESSLAMIRARPLTGWGLETYVPVYRMFATYDDGTFVNRAHNDWLQWAAEGGLPFAAMMLALFVWSVPVAVRSGWGIGVIAICLHALVDYPFARLGVCGWYFALIGMLAARENRSNKETS